jgi:hypothetical protein
MKVRKIDPQPQPPTHLLAVSDHEMKAIRRAAEAYIQDEHRERSGYYKEALNGVLSALNKAIYS